MVPGSGDGPRSVVIEADGGSRGNPGQAAYGAVLKDAESGELIAERAEAILVCVDKPETTDRIVELCQAEFPQAKLYVRAYDRGHVLRLVKAGVEYQIRELFESALAFGQAVLEGLGFQEDDAADAIADVRKRDEERRELELVGGVEAGRVLMRNNTTTFRPEPFVKPRRQGQVIDVVEDPPEAPAPAN